jgi:MGT family glycosyltransferase
MIIYEQFFFLGKHLAEQCNKPVVRIFTAPVANKTLMNEYISSGGPLGVFRYKWVARAWTKDIAKNISMKTDNWLDEIIENPPELNLVYTLREYQPYAEAFPDEQYKFLGPSIYKRQSKPFDFVKGEKPVVYISLGTIVKGAKKFFQQCIEAFRDEPVNVIISTGKTFDAQKLKNIPSNVQIYPSVPQIEVLRMADVFVTHGGMNSISEALVYGVPMIVIPFMTDQPVNAGQVETLGLGKRVEYKSINSLALKESVLSVLSDEEIKANLANAQKWIVNAPGNKGGVAMIREYYEKHR